MCGRFNVSADPMARLFLLLAGMEHPGLTAHNLAPTENTWVLVPARAQSEEQAASGSHDDQSTAHHQPYDIREMRWWLTPYWSKTLRTKFSSINARAERIHNSRAFASSFERRRCIVPADGFYEWLKDGKARLPQHVRAVDGEALTFAGIWDRWRGEVDGEQMQVEGFAIVTTDVHPALAFLHNRQPVMLSHDEAHIWLDHAQPLGVIQALTAPSIPTDLTVTPVSQTVNNVRNKGPECLSALGNPRFVSASTRDGSA